jgi:C4-dicarboxylate-specific signal transduction histidine kinase|tara:strand:+ start:552 stop:791 length:240 start_codon:yes stop_codon:yes gene_type:complete
MIMKVGEALLQAARKQAEGQVAVHIANIKVYQTMPAGIGEHSDITEAVMAELDKLATANDRLEMLDKYFSNEDQMPLFS